MDTMEPILAAHPFFRGLDSRYLKLIVECASRETFTPNRFLCQDNEEARKFYVIHHGRVAVEIYRPRRGAVTVQTIGCLLYTSPSPRDRTRSRMPSSA